MYLACEGFWVDTNGRGISTVLAAGDPMSEAAFSNTLLPLFPTWRKELPSSAPLGLHAYTVANLTGVVAIRLCRVPTCGFHRTR